MKVNVLMKGNTKLLLSVNFLRVNVRIGAEMGPAHPDLASTPSSDLDFPNTGILASHPDNIYEMAQHDFGFPVPSARQCVLSFPAPSVLLVRLNRPKELNCVNLQGHEELEAIWEWLDKEPKLAVGIITGTGRAFSAGADLKGMETSSWIGCWTE